MFLTNTHRDYGEPLDTRDADLLGSEGAARVQAYLARRDNHRVTPLNALPEMANKLGVAAVHVKDEGQRLGLGSFKALGGAYVVSLLVAEEAGHRLGRTIRFENLTETDVRAVAATMTFACATDGNHGRSVAQGAEIAGARAVIFIHAGVSHARADAIAKFGAEIRRFPGTYDDSVAEAARVADANGWTVLSDTSWEGYERIPGLVMQGYTAIAREALAQMDRLPTHVFIQAGVGGIAAALAGHFSLTLDNSLPKFIVVEPDRAACIFAAALAGHPVKTAHGEPTIMAMLECYVASPVAWRVLCRAADAFMTVDEDDALSIMRRLANPDGSDPAIVAGESGGVGLAGLVKAASDVELRAALGLDERSSVLVVNTEGATDPALYERLVGKKPEDV